MVRIYRTLKRAQRGFTIDLNDLFGTPGAQRPGEEPRQRYGWSGRRAKKKKIGDDVGEYVKFQEVAATEESDSRGREETSYAVEQQITDVEWEEIS